MKLFILILILFCFASVAIYAGDSPPPRSSTSGPGDVVSPPPIPSNALDLSFLPTIESGGLAPANTPEKVASVLQIIVLLTFITLAPGLLMLLTCFLRILIVFSFLRRALGTQTMPPDQMLVGIALVLTVFIMYPTWTQSWENGLQPFLTESLDPVTGQALTQREMFTRMLEPQRDFMMRCLEANDGLPEIEFFMGVSGHQQRNANNDIVWIGENGRELTQSTELLLSDIPTVVLIPSFISSELKRAFWMGFLLYLPFLIMDMVISSILMSMGMMMLPPVMISLPFKIVMFILIDGWQLLMEATVMSFPPSVLNFAPVLQ